MKALEWCDAHADALFLLPRAASSSELPLGAGAEAWGRHENMYVTMLELGNLNL